MTMAAMLLGHWYLNTPTMELVPLRRLIIAMGVAVVLQADCLGARPVGRADVRQRRSRRSGGCSCCCGGRLASWGSRFWPWMAWETLKIPNTQSATGILYVAVIGTFVGETMALLLSAESLFPL